MSIDMQPSVPENTPSRTSYSAVYTTIWNTITAHKSEPSLDVRIHDTLAPILADLQNQREQDPNALCDIHFHRALLAAELAPLLTLTEQDFQAMPQEAFQGATERVREVAVSHIRDILHAFEVGVWVRDMEALDGILHELTPLGLYSQGDTLLLPASDAEDRYRKTDLNAYQKTDTIRHERVQCKRNKISSPPIQDVILIDASDYSNRASQRKGIRRLNNTSHLLVEAADGDMAAHETVTAIGRSFWELAEYRLSEEFETAHRAAHIKAMPGIRFMARIPASMLEKYL